MEFLGEVVLVVVLGAELAQVRLVFDARTVERLGAADVVVAPLKLAEVLSLVRRRGESPAPTLPTLLEDGRLG